MFPQSAADSKTTSPWNLFILGRSQITLQFTSFMVFFIVKVFLLSAQSHDHDHYVFRLSWSVVFSSPHVMTILMNSFCSNSRPPKLEGSDGEGEMLLPGVREVKF